MTLLEIVLTVPAADGAQVPAAGVLRFAPTKRRVLNGTTVLPKPFQVPLLLGMATVDLAANDASWVWRIDEHVSGTPARTIYTNIPDAVSFLYTDLVSIDPATLAPTADLTPAWAQRVTDLEAALAATPEPSPAITPDPDDPGFFLIGA